MIQHVSLEVRREDAEASIAFWALLGFAEVDPPAPLGEVSRWVEREGTQIHLLFTDTPHAVDEGHVAVVARDFDGAIAALRSAGFDPEEHTPYWGAARSFVRDPNGHLVEVMAAPPGPLRQT